MRPLVAGLAQLRSIGLLRAGNDIIELPPVFGNSTQLYLKIGLNVVTRLTVPAAPLILGGPSNIPVGGAVDFRHDLINRIV